MSEISVRPLTEQDWELFRSVRLKALKESPEAFVANVETEEGYDEDFWRLRLGRARRLLAEVDGAPVGIVSVGAYEDEEAVAQLFGLWVAPTHRGSGVATELVRAGARAAAAEDNRQLVYWVGTENPRAVGFASGFGFRPTADRRPMRVASDTEGEEEIAMVLPLGGDRGGIATY